MAKPSQVIVIVEDKHQKQLIFRYLRRLPLESHAIRFLLPTSGSGEQWVRERFAVEINAYRRRAARAETRLIVVVDADNLTVAERMRQLNKRLEDNDVGPVQQDEQVATLVPKRNVETWLLCLLGNTVEENTDYKQSRNDWEELIPPAAETLYDWSRASAQIRESCVESLRLGIVELRRLDFSAR